MEMSNKTYLTILKALDTLESNQRAMAASPDQRAHGTDAYWRTEADKTARAAHDVRVLKAYCEEPTLSFSQ